MRERESECRQRRHTVQSLRPREVGANVCTSCSGRGGVRGREVGEQEGLLSRVLDMSTYYSYYSMCRNVASRAA